MGSNRKLGNNMYIFVDAVYKNGEFILNEKLDPGFEGKKVKLIVFDGEEGLELKKKKFFNFVKHHSFKIPQDYRFNRDDLYQR